MAPTHADPDHAGRLHHIELAASDLDDALPFWDWLLPELDYEQKTDWENGRSWIAGPTYVVLKQASATDHPFDREAPGLDHVAFHAASREQVDDLTTTIRVREDAELLFPDRHPYAGGYYALYCTGPDGVKVEVVGPEE